VAAHVRLAASAAALAVADAVKVSAVLICRNESAHIGACLDSIRKGVDEIVVLDTGSTDDTCDVARKHGADVVQSDPSLLVELARSIAADARSGENPPAGAAGAIAVPKGATDVTGVDARGAAAACSRR
jgi:glycosyltransferase involved in cell wall biosynthesis